MTKLTKTQWEEIAPQVAAHRHAIHSIEIKSDESAAEYREKAQKIEELLNTSLAGTDDYEYCDDVDCGDVWCIDCEQADVEYISDVKEKNNEKIESIMQEYDREYDTEYAPTGMSRAIWAENVR